MKEGEDYLVVMVYCCKEWPILAGVGWGRCGDCGEKPQHRPEPLG
jgi:hypothetical protein